MSTAASNMAASAEYDQLPVDGQPWTMSARVPGRAVRWRPSAGSPRASSIPSGAQRDDRGAFDPGVASEYARIQQQPDPDAMTTEEWFHDP